MHVVYGFLQRARLRDMYVVVSFLKPCTHWRQSRQSPKPATNQQQSWQWTLSPVCQESTVAGLFDVVDRVAVDIVNKVEHVQLGWLCWKWVIFVGQMSNVLSALSPVFTGPKQHFLDFRWIRLCRLCVVGFSGFVFLNISVVYFSHLYFTAVSVFYFCVSQLVCLHHARLEAEP